MIKFILFTSAFGDDAQKTFIDKIFPNFWDFLTQLLAFLVLLAVVIIFGYKPIKKLLDARKNYVKENLDGSLKAKLEAEEASKVAQKEINESKIKASKIVEEAKLEATKEREKIIEAAKEDAKKELIKASEDVELAKKAAKESIQKEIVDVALQASTQLLGREVSSKDNKKLVEDFVSSIEEDK